MSAARRASGDRGVPPPQSPWFSATAAVSSLVDDLRRFLAANLAWMLVAAVTTFAGVVNRPAYVLGLLLVPVSCGVLRMAGEATRGHSPRLSHFRDGVRHRFWLHLTLGVVQALLLGVAVVNVGVGVAGGGLLPSLAAIVSGYVALATWLVATAAWPLLLDPRRNALPWTAALRLALAVVATRPLGLVAVAAAEVVLISATVEIAVLGLILPSYGALLAAQYVIPAADRVESQSRALRGRA